MRLGISSYTYGWAVGTDGNRPPSAMTALDLIDRASEFGVRVLQLCDNLPPETFNEDSLEAIASLAAKRQLQIEVGTRGIALEHLRRFAKIAWRLSSNILRVVIDTPEDQPTVDQVISRLTEAMPAFADAGVALAIENHDRFPVSELVRIVRQINSKHLGICLDTANSFGALEGPRVVVDTLGPHAVNLHLKDIAVQRFPHAQGFTIQGRPAGHGMLDIPWLLGRLQEFNRDINAIIELWTPPAPSLDETIRKEAQWAKLSVQTLRQWINQ